MLFSQVIARKSLKYVYLMHGVTLATPLWGHQLKRSGGESDPPAPLVAGVHAFIMARAKPMLAPPPTTRTPGAVHSAICTPQDMRPISHDRPSLHALDRELTNADPATQRCAAPPRNTL